jgi:lysophospholipase L1-like esterase
MAVEVAEARPHLTWRKKLGYSLLVCFVTLLSLEVAVRIGMWALHLPHLYEADPELGYTLRPNLDVARRTQDKGNIRIRTDGEGNRIVPEGTAGPVQGTILLLGDSFAFGEGVDEQVTVAASLAAAGWKVVNLGVCGYGTNQELLRFRRYAAQHAGEFQWVIVLVYTNDEEDVRSSYKFARTRPTASWDGQQLTLRPFHLPWTDRLTDLSALYWLGRHLIWNRPIIEPGTGHAAVAACLAAVEKEAKAVGAKALLVMQDGQKPELASPFVSAAQEQGIVLHDLSPVLNRHLKAGEKLLIADGVHWNAAGSRLVARELLQMLAAH